MFVYVYEMQSQVYEAIGIILLLFTKTKASYSLCLYKKNRFSFHSEMLLTPASKDSAAHVTIYCYVCKYCAHCFRYITPMP